MNRVSALVIVLGGLPEPDWLNEPYYDADGTFAHPDMRFRRPSSASNMTENNTRRPNIASRISGGRTGCCSRSSALRYVAKDVYGTPQTHRARGRDDVVPRAS